MEDDGSGFLNTSASSLSLLCSSRHLMRSRPLPVSAEGLLAITSFQYIYCFTILVLGMLLNSAIVFAVITSKNLRTLDMAVALQIVFLNILRIVLDLVPSVISLIATEWMFGPYVCSLQGFLSFLLFSLRRILVFAMAIDRFLLVFSTFTYPKHRSKVMAIATVVTWIFTIAFSTVGIPGLLDCYTLRDSRIACHFNGSCSYACSVYGYLSFAIIGIPTYGLPIFLYGALLHKSRKMINHFDQNESRRSIRRSTFTFFLLFITCFVFTIPSTGTIVIARIISQNHGFSSGLRMVLFFLTQTSLLLIVMDAVIIIRHRDIQDRLKQQLRGIKKWWDNSCLNKKL